MKEEVTAYEDIIELPHHVSLTRKRMSLEDRAAQFSPFAALTGYEAAVQETARLTEPETELTEDEKQLLDEKLRILAKQEERMPRVTVTYFLADSKKEGGSYEQIAERIKRIDGYERKLFFNDGTVLSMEQIRQIEGECLESLTGGEDPLC